jgi:hypothetical protein
VDFVIFVFILGLKIMLLHGKPTFFFFMAKDHKHYCILVWAASSGVPRKVFFFWGGGGSANSFVDSGQKARGYGGGSPIVRGSGGSCNLV